MGRSSELGTHEVQRAANPVRGVRHEGRSWKRNVMVAPKRGEVVAQAATLVIETIRGVRRQHRLRCGQEHLPALVELGHGCGGGSMGGP